MSSSTRASTRKRTNKETTEEPQTSPKKIQKTQLAVGDTIPDVKLVNQQGSEVSLEDLVKENGIIIFMYPKANTPGCTKQACGFRDDIEKIEKAGFKVYGLSADSPKSQTTWKNKYELPYDLLCDPEFKAIKAFGAFKAPKNIKRSHLIFDKGGKVLQVAIQVSPGDSVSQAVEFVEKRKK